ncbi:MAG: nucleotidyltransferase family protein [Desulfurococcales archaeon]|nr:nucleotidyltransferase family protein [Desulfurococcales archaeon]
MSLAVILAGGYGKRLRPLTETTPKPLLRVAGKPIIVHQIEWLREYGYSEFVVTVGWLKEKLISELGSGSRYGVTIVYAVEEEPLGTGGAIHNIKDILSKREEFLVLNGDVLTNLNPQKLYDPLREGYAASIAAVELKSTYGVIDIDDSGRVRSFREKPVIPEYWINAGVYAMTPRALKYMPEKGDVERTALPQMASDGVLAAVKYSLRNIYWRSIDSHKDLEEASKEIEMMGGLIRGLKE